MAKKFRALAAAGGGMMAMAISAPVWAQKQGGILRQYMIGSPASMSIHEEATPVATRPVTRRRLQGRGHSRAFPATA